MTLPENETSQDPGPPPDEQDKLLMEPQNINVLRSQEEGETPQKKIPPLSQDIKGKDVAGSQDINLKRELGLFSAVSLIISVMIGSGIFVSPSSALQRSGSVGEALVVWAACGGISLLGALAFAELGIVVPQSGAEYSYFRAAFSPLHKFAGPLPSFLYVWVVVLILRPAEVAIIVLTFAEYVYDPIATSIDADLTHTDQELLKKLIGTLALGAITFVNFKSVKLFVQMNNIFSSFKILVCIIVIGGGIYNLSLGNVENLSSGFEGSKTGIKDIILAVYSGLWAYDGWSSVVIVSEEVKKPNRNIPLSIVIGVPLVTCLYTMMNIAYMSVLTFTEMISVPAVAVAFGDKILGPLKIVIPIGVALSTFSCAMGVQFGVSRLCFAAGREGHMLESISYIHVRRYTPAPAVGMQALLTLLFMVSGDIVSLIEFASFLIWMFYGLAFVALIVLRKTKADAYRPYKVPIIIPVVLAILSAIIAGVPIVMDPAPEYIAAVLFMLLGVVVYYPLVYKRKRLPCMDKFNYFIQVLMEVAPPTKVPDAS
ncbi:b(0,+)-type amino acid transporter 1-like [Macrosteles quadrilineatus]|uniref:b(0,+)-type amino acid transporter 1-like n=1 Tax=Macrosteles quadrilineatus TaxID=74068 RepID=UPI0023E0EF10|nr:b(0,+)-type amino acid transporter 1-like [Macrosteles quadrilineatus]